MKVLALFAALLLSTAVLAEDAASDVVVLNEENFDSTIKPSEKWLVEFYAPWCGHCKNLAPEWEKTATALKGKIGVAKVNVEAERSLQERFGVQGFPTIVLIHNGKYQAYEGARTTEAFTEFAEKGINEEKAKPVPPKVLEEEVPEGPSNVVELDDSNFEHLTQAASGATTGVWIVELYAPWCGHCKRLVPVYEKLATALKGEVNVAKVDGTTSPVTMKRFQARGFPTILALKDGKYYSYEEGDRSFEALKKWATGGFAASEGNPVPPEPTQLELIQDAVKKIFTDSYNVAVHVPHVPITYALAGLFLGLVLGAFLFSGPKIIVADKPKTE